MYDDEEDQQNSERSYNPDEIGSDPSITLGLFRLCFLFFRFGMAKLLLTFLIFCLFNFFLLLWKLGKNVWFFIKFSQKSHKKVNKKTKFFVQKSVHEPKESERKIFTYSPRVLNYCLSEVRHDFDESSNWGYEGRHDFDESANWVYEGRHDFDEFTNWGYKGRHDFDESANWVDDGRHNFDEFANLGVLNDCQYQGRHDIDESANFLRDDGFAIGDGIDKFSCDDNIGFGIGDLSENVRGPNDLIRLPQCLSDPALKLPTVTTAQGSAEDEKYEKTINLCMEISSSPQCIEIPQLAGPALQPDAFPNVGKIMQVDSSEQESSVRFDAANIGGNVVSANKNCTTTCSQKKNTITELVPLFGLTREAAAKEIGVSIPTLKRLCRRYGISRWPHHRNKKLCRSLQQLGRSLQQKLAADSDQGAAGAFGHFVTGSHTGAIGSNHHNSPCSKPAKRQREKKTSPSCNTPSTVATCSDPAPAPMQAMPTFPQIMPQLRAGQDARIEISKTTDDILIQSVEGVTTRSCLSPQKRAGSDVPSTSSPKHFHCTEIVDQMLESSHSAPKGQRQEQNRFQLQKQNAGTATIKATYGNKTARVPPSATSGIVKLKEELARRLELEHGSFDVEYEDEDHEWIVIACDDALQECLTSSTSSDNQVIRLAVRDKVVNSQNSGKALEC